MYSLHGFDEWIASVVLQVCHFWMVSSYCAPGSPQMCVPWAIKSRSAAASMVSTGSPEVTARRS